VTPDTFRLKPAAAAFALAAAITILFNTCVACVKDAYQPLSRFMAHLAGHNWTTQGLADIILFSGLGLAFMKSGWAGRIHPQRVITFLVAAVVVAGVGLFAWYALF
jgi:uncharacterized membrane protein SirB2